MHHRASIWYAEHDQTTEAILHAFHARQWQWAADLIERKSLPLLAQTWGASEHALALLQKWLGQLPADIVGSRPRLCLTCAHMLWTVAPYPQLDGWLNAAKAVLTASLTTLSNDNVSHPMLASQGQQENLLGEVITWQAFLRSFLEDEGEGVLPLCQQALSLLSPENTMGRAFVALPQLTAPFLSSVNNAGTAIERGTQGGMFAQEAGHIDLALTLMGTTACFTIGAGRLHEAYELTQQAISLGCKPGGRILPEVGYPTVFQAEILREWSQLDAALSLVEKGISLCQENISMALLVHIHYGYVILVRVLLSRGELQAACTAFQQVKRISKSFSRPLYLHFRSLYTAVDQVRLWLACGELDQATRWAQELDLTGREGTPFAREREEVACARIFLAQGQPILALQRLEPVLQRATMGQRWGHVIEIRLLQALAHQMCHEVPQALSTLSEAIRLAEPQGYIRRFVDEGTPMATLLSRLQQEQRKAGPTPYLDTLLAAFPQWSKGQAGQLKRAGEHPKTQLLLDPLSERELQVLQLIAKGASNQQIAQELVIAIDTVKRHVSHIFSKLGVNNRVQVVMQARRLSLLDEES